MYRFLTMVTGPNRPLSPHLQIYRLPLTALLSITHRITGVVLSLGLIFLITTMLAIASNETFYSIIHSFLNNLLGQSFLLLWLFALFLHFCHGIRHLIWDAALGFERSTLTRHSLWELSLAVFLAGISWTLL